MGHNGFPRGVTQRGNRFLVDKTVKGVRILETFETLPEALTFMGEAVDAIKAGKPMPSRAAAEAWTLGRALEVTRDNVWAGTPSEKTALINAQAAVNFFGRNYPLTDINPASLDNYVAHLKANGSKHGTINRKLSALSKMMNEAVKRGGLDRRTEFPRMKESEGRIRQMSYAEESQVLQLFKQWGKDDHHDATVVLVDTGLRVGELWKMEAHNLDFRQGDFGIITVYGTFAKNKTSRTVPLTERAAEVLARRARSEGPLFPGANNYWFHRQWQRAREVMGLADDPYFVPHVLRHTCISRLVQGGMPLALVQAWAGHKNIQTTMRYAQLAPTMLYQGVGMLAAHREQYARD